MRSNTLNRHFAWWLTPDSILGFEGEGDNTPDANKGGGEDNNGDKGDDGGDDNPGSDNNEDVSGLKSALTKERADRKKLEKELKAFRTAKQEQDDRDKTDVERLTDLTSKQQQKLEKLAAGFKTSAIRQAVLKAAGEAKFTDPTDALRDEVLSSIEVEQDDDDPTLVTIDAASVTKAVQALAKAKPHYLNQSKSDGGTPPPPSGSKFGGSGTGNNNAKEQQLTALYPALQNR